MDSSYVIFGFCWVVFIVVQGAVLRRRQKEQLEKINAHLSDWGEKVCKAVATGIVYEGMS